LTHIHLATSKRQDHHGSHIHDLKQEENIGKRYGDVVITSTSVHPQSKKTLYRCLCDCGKVTDASLEAVFRGNICGTHRKIYRGRRFGYLVTSSKRRGEEVYCRCDCGNERYVRADKLLGGRTKSCGTCYNGRIVVGQKFGRLLVIRGFGGKFKSKYFLCSCDCGVEVKRRRDHLLHRKTKYEKSCGCAEREYRESHKKILADTRWCDRTFVNTSNYLYVIEEEGGNFKVGISNNPERRLRLLQCGNPRKLELISVFDNEPGLEKLIHITLDHRKLNGEWFRPC